MGQSQKPVVPSILGALSQGPCLEYHGSTGLTNDDCTDAGGGMGENWGWYWEGNRIVGNLYQVLFYLLLDLSFNKLSFFTLQFVRLF